jgi:hypothetical protein
MSQSHSCVLLAVCQVLSALEHVFIKDLSIFAPLIFASILTSLPVPDTEKHPHSMILPPPCHRDGARFPPDVTLSIQAKEFNLGFIRPENFMV